MHNYPAIRGELSPEEWLEDAHIFFEITSRCPEYTDVWLWMSLLNWALLVYEGGIDV